MQRTGLSCTAAVGTRKPSLWDTEAEEYAVLISEDNEYCAAKCISTMLIVRTL